MTSFPGLKQRAPIKASQATRLQLHDTLKHNINMVQSICDNWVRCRWHISVIKSTTQLAELVSPT